MNANEKNPATENEEPGRWLTWEEAHPGETPKRKNNLGVYCSRCKNRSDRNFAYCPNCGLKIK